MDRDELLERVRAGRRNWDDLIASVPRERMLEPLWENGWDVKDIVAHVDFLEWWVGEFIRKRGWPDVDALLNAPDVDEQNNAIYELNKDRSLDDVLSESASRHESLVNVLTGLTDDDVRDPKPLIDPPPDDSWTLERLVEGNTWGHYPQHAPDIQNLLARTS